MTNAQYVERAATFFQLGKALDKSPLLKRPMHEVVPQLIAPPGYLAELRNLLEGYSRLSVGQFFARPDMQAQLEDEAVEGAQLVIFKRWALNQQPKPKVTDLDLARGLVERAGIPGLGSWQVTAFGPYWRAGVSVDAFLKGETPGNEALNSQLVDGLRSFVVKLERAREVLVATTADSTTGDEALDRLRRLLIRAREPTLRAIPPGVLDSFAHLYEDGRTLRVSVQRILMAYDPVAVSTVPSRWTDVARVTCPCGLSVCPFEASALDLLIAQTVDPKSHAARLLVELAQPTWQRLLEGLEQGPPHDTSEKPVLLSFHFGGNGRLALMQHTEGKRGLSIGKRVPKLETLMPRLAGADLRFAELALPFFSGAVREPPGEAMLALEGHPRVFNSATSQPLKVVVESAQAVVEETSEGVVISANAGGARIEIEKMQAWPLRRGRLVFTLTHDSLVLSRLNRELDHLLQLTHRFGETLPKEALPKLARLLPSIEAVATVDLPESLRGHELPAKALVVVRLERKAAQLRLSVMVEPLENGPLFIAGQGAVISATFDGQRRTFANRQFDAELREASSVVGALSLDPTLAAEPFVWVLPAGDASVDTLRRLASLGEQGLRVEWPDKRPTFHTPIGLDSLSLKVSRQRDWFGLEGAAQSGAARVTLAQLLEAARRRRSWVRVGEDEYVTLEDSVLSSLEPIATLSEGDAAPTLTLGTLPLVDALSKEVADFDATEDFSVLLKRLEETKVRTYAVPKGIKTPLRDYQVEGYRWLSRLADWGAGACLADDMGLGKTLQALTLLVSRAKRGPALVVAPSSVMHTWRIEAERHAPTLRITLLQGVGDSASEALRAGDVAVISWSAFARMPEAISLVPWATAIFDEAHAIKNASTQRARAAHALKADFIVALTGTPVENHVGELWSLMRAVMPSLLGSQESFERRFGRQNKESVKALSELVKPFILRRSKAKVAKELPPRTDVEVVVPLTEEEKALYDDVRLSAIASLAEGAAEGQGQMKVFAALNRLRLTACHPKLVDATWRGPTSKLTKLLELIRDLLAGEHRLLVFSQFTQHLALVAEALGREGIAHSYLDGQTPIKERQRRVEAFQAGQGGGVFLISLKAGGTGLTLTAADYVVHLDPWWNPAVEDQASDRAHRLGQTKPVTVYRLISEGTVEQQILSLHAQKRELVDDLLAGTDSAGRLSSAQLAELIRAGSAQTAPLAASV